jgi:ribosomal protein L12E/L44/L45/RPP1/RPP2
LSGKNFVLAKTPANPLHSPAVQHRGVTVHPSSIRGTPMMKLSSRVATIALASLLLTGSAFAQATAPATPAPAAKATPAPAAPTEKKAEKPRTAASLECSKEADAKGLHGKERKKFRSECRKAAADKAK